jgi:peptidyl-prolyl cis-trans isomerase SurA
MKAAIGLMLVAALAAPTGAAEILEQVLVKVNGDIITKTDLEARQIAALRERMKAPVSADALRTDEGLKKALAEITPQLLVDAIDELLMVQLGREKGYRLSDDQFKSWLDNLRKEQNLVDEAKFQAALKQEGMTVQDLRINVERQMLIQRVRQDEVGSKLQITEEEARQYYLTHRDQFVSPATVTLREILIEVPTTAAGMNVAEEDKARAQLAEIRRRISAGEDFTKIVAEVSASPSKANGGLIGPLKPAELSPSLQQMLERMKPGDISDPLRTPRGLQILKLESLKPSATQPFESVRDLVADRVHEQRQIAEIRRFLSRVRGQALIEWKNQDLRKAYEQQLSTLAPQPGLDD